MIDELRLINENHMEGQMAKTSDQEKKQTIICPMFPAIPTKSQFTGQPQFILADCVKERCAWYHTIYAECSAKLIAKGVQSIENILSRQERGSAFKR